MTILFKLQMFRGVIKYVAFLGVLIGIGIITKVLEQIVESASIKGKPQHNNRPFSSIAASHKFK